MTSATPSAQKQALTTAADLVDALPGHRFTVRVYAHDSGRGVELHLTPSALGDAVSLGRAKVAALAALTGLLDDVAAQHEPLSPPWPHPGDQWAEITGTFRGVDVVADVTSIGTREGKAALAEWLADRFPAVALCPRAICSKPAEAPSVFCQDHRPPNNPPPFPGTPTRRALPPADAHDGDAR